MSTAIIGSSDPVFTTSSANTPVVALRRRTIDSVLVSIGALAAVVLFVAGGLLTWGHRFADDYVHDELASQHITFPSTDALTAEGRTDLLAFAGQKLDTGDGAEAYASYINGHLQGIAGRRDVRRPRWTRADGKGCSHRRCRRGSAPSHHRRSAGEGDGDHRPA
jgi:hypothetical protein